MAIFTHMPLRLCADPQRVVIRPFHLAVEPRDLNPVQTSRAHRIVEAVRAMDEATCLEVLRIVHEEFAHRHWETHRFFERRYEQIAAELGLKDNLKPDQRQLIGAYLSHEYAYAAAALMNPSVVPHPDQNDAPRGALRFVMSLRAVGEGHISSIEFREGLLSRNGDMTLAKRPPVSVAAEARVEGERVVMIREPETALSGTVLFPATPAQRNGLEDLRLVRFEDDEDGPVYYGTYTAYSGSAIASQLLQTRDFQTFILSPMTGAASRNKGMALFPRRIGGRYAMIGRQDNENLYYLESDDVAHWETGEKIAAPVYPWELVQIGNCGAPVEIDEGWLLLTHGVGPMRKYSIGALLLDKKNPRRVLARTREPILSPADDTRVGYVPNVVYTCGALAFGRRMFMPFGVSDSCTMFSWLDIDALVRDMV
ncbi:glycoside hydrolase family 130 protein [Amphiplicatus metriothermophilus]|uniref:Glycosidase n=1 Tax=Amphiplicatus metriothermophilus TaxID=1519374 RepID=A0A239PPJ2_9PROT|nr:glycoside hydrolase family 130 protein [Amphiplicatus metriothermophilus]MBB5518623.1 putative GH43/DUF377 family glycosyl hydrolase [Amphiplicatus metriothermophilus]SNT72219.1 protein of unknown function [Amphiplicatus metriothermophilus]